VTCIAEGKQSWFNKRDGSLAPFSPPFATESVATRKLSTNINSWVMRYSMHSFEQMLKGSATEAAQSLEYQLRIGVEGRASAAFSYALFRPDLKIRIHTADGRYLTPIERSLDILANCNDASTAYHDKTCRHTSALAPHKYSGMLFALSEIQGRAAAVLNRPEWSAAKLANVKARYREQMELTLARLKQTESQQGMEDNLDPEVKSFMNRKGVPIKPWAYGSAREKMVAGYAAIAEKWAQKPQIIGRNYVGLIQLPMPEYAKGGACVGCHQQADENFEAGFRPHY
jgi:hypothetical protein